VLNPNIIEPKMYFPKENFLKIKMYNEKMELVIILISNSVWNLKFRIPSSTRGIGMN